MSERVDELPERRGGERAVNPAVPLGELGIVVLGAQHHLKCSRATHQAREVLGRSAAGQLTERRLELAEDRRLARREAHVTGENELAARGPDPALYLRDGHEPAGTQVTKHQPDRCLAGQLGRLGPVLGHSVQVDMGDEVVGICACEHEHASGVVRFGALDQRDQVADQFGSQEIHRGSRDLREHDATFLADVERLERA